MAVRYITMEEVKQLKKNEGLSMQDAKKILERDRFVEALVEAEDFEQLRQVILYAFNVGMIK
jgi:translation elongation factor EF-Ts